MITVKELMKYAFGVGSVRVVDQPYEVLFHGYTMSLKRDARNSHILERTIESFSITDTNTITITLTPATPQEIEEKEQNLKQTRVKNNYKKGSYKLEG